MTSISLRRFGAWVVLASLVAAIGCGDLGPGAGAIASLRVTLHESHVAAASYDAPLPALPRP